MFYLYSGKVFIGRRAIPQDTPENEVQKLTAIHPAVNQYQYLEAENGIVDADNLTYTLAVKNIRRYAKCDHNWIVQSIADELQQAEQIPIPYALNTRIDIGWIFDGETFAPLDLIGYLDSERKNALAAIAEKHTEMLTIATGGATAAERDTWIVKEAAARDVIAGGTGGGALRPVGGETLEQLAHKILVKAQGYKMLVGIADEIKRTAEKAVEALTLESVDDLAALDAVLETAKQQALAALQQATAT